jgi:23S rRNA-/tRNA-specific pseudouridylate synthase
MTALLSFLEPMSPGKPCITKFHVADRFEGYTSVRAHPLTRRRHQIRVHFYSIGHPIVGDLRYGDKLVQRTFPRLMLHAQGIALRLPSGQEVAIEAPIPETFRLAMEMVCQS